MTDHMYSLTHSSTGPNLACPNAQLWRPHHEIHCEHARRTAVRVLQVPTSGTTGRYTNCTCIVDASLRPRMRALARARPRGAAPPQSSRCRIVDPGVSKHRARACAMQAAPGALLVSSNSAAGARWRRTKRRQLSVLSLSHGPRRLPCVLRGQLLCSGRVARVCER